ncbi:MAG: PD40 domain-containing protein, partial [Myxococcales bacterium]|nr:PD40 domain-containing protein [Myxococcales bacterium]
MGRKLTLWIAVALAACSGNRPTQSRAPERKPTAAATEAPKPPPPVVRAPPREDNRGVMGGPRDDTAFEWDVADVDDVVEPELENIPPISRFVATQLAPYLETRRAKLATQGPAGHGIVVLTRLAEATHLHQVLSPLALREQLTFGRDPVEQGAFSPSGLLTYRGDQLGTENFQIWDLNLETRNRQLLTDGESRNGGFRWLTDGSLAFTSNRRNGTDMDLYLLSAKAAAQGKPATLAAELPGQWVIQSTSRDAKQILLLEYLAADQATLHVLDLETGKRRPVRELEPGVSTTLGLFSGKPGEVYALSDRGGEFARVFKIDTDSGVWTPVTARYKWNVEEFALSGDGKLLAFTLNEDGYSMLYLQPLPKGNPRPARSIPRGVISALRFADARSLLFNLSTPTSPPDVFGFDIRTSKLTAWTRSEVGGMPKSSLVNPTIVTTKAPDGT